MSPLKAAEGAHGTMKFTKQIEVIALLLGNKDTHGLNSKRLAEVWMDEYTRLFYSHRKDLVVSDVGTSSSREISVNDNSVVSSWEMSIKRPCNGWWMK